MKKKILPLLRTFTLCLITFISFCGIKVCAEELPGQFGVKAILPENQIDQNISYFNLLVKPNQSQTLEVELQNLANKERTFDISINPAVTSDGGTIDYSQKNAKLDNSVPFDIRKYITLNQSSVKIRANSTLKVPINISMPDKKFKGRILAGFTVKPKEDDIKPSKEKKSETQIINRLAYSIAISLQQNKEKIAPDLKLLNASAKDFNSLPYIALSFQNPSGTIINDLIFETKLYHDGKLFIENTSNPFLVAPTSNFNLRLDLDGHKVSSGSYDVVVHAKSKENSWTFNKKFTVSEKNANKVNNNTVYAEKGMDWKLLTIIILLVALSIITILYIYKKLNKSKKEIE